MTKPAVNRTDVALCLLFVAYVAMVTWVRLR